MSCQLDDLCDLPTDARRRKALTCLPSDLPETYARVLTRVEKSTRPLLRRTLQWIAYASYPGLSIEQLCEIVSIGENDEKLDPEACPDLEDLLRYCGSLVRRTNSSPKSLSYGRLELAHFTVQQFLETINPEDMELKEFRLSSTDTLTLARTCLNYLCLPSFDRLPSDCETGLEGHPFYEHVSRYLNSYIKGIAHEENLQEHLQKLFRPPKSYNLTRFILHHIRVMGIELAEDKRFDKVCSHEFGSLHAAAMLHLGTVCRWLLDKGCIVNQASALGTPLELVMIGSSSKFLLNRTWNHLNRSDTRRTICTLLEAGATWNAKGVDTEALLDAVSSGPTGILIDMLRYGMPVPVEAIDRIENRGSHEAMERFLIGIDGVENLNIPLDLRMRLLDLARKGNINLKASLPIDTTMGTTRMMSNIEYAKTIEYTAKYGPVSDLLRLTLDERFSVNMKTPCRSATLLHRAAEYDSPECIELLLDRGFDAAQLDKHGQTVLHHAISSDVREVALLHRMVQSNAPEIVYCDGGSVWHIVAERGRLDVFDILIERLGPDHPSFNMQNKLGRTPLLEAILHRKSHVASRILRSFSLENILMIDASVIHSVVATGLEDVLQDLVEIGATLHTASDHDQNPLYFITRETSPSMLRTLLDLGLDPNYLDSYGRSPLVDLLELDLHSQRLEALGFSKLDCTKFDMSIVEILATPYCIVTQDNEKNSAWFYFCTKTIAHVVARLDLRSELDSLIGLSDILIQRGALEAYEAATTESGIALLIKVCLDAISEIRTWDQQNAVLFVKTILQRALETITPASLPDDHQQAVRLLIWSMLESENDILEQLLRLGVNVHTSCEDYGGDSAIDIAIERPVGEKSFDLILAHADPSRIPKLDADGSMRHFILCSPEKLAYANKWTARGKRLGTNAHVSRLRALLKKGVDPNARSIHHWTAAMIAAIEGQLECVKSLVAYSANLLLKDKQGWTVIHSAIASGKLIVLEYLRQMIKQDEEWKRPAAFFVPLTNSQCTPLGPLSQKGYLRCSPIHLAAYNDSSDTLRFLRDHDILGKIDMKAQDGVTPLHFAVCMSSSQTTRWLLEKGADVNATCGTSNISALHVAFRLGHLENAIALIEYGAEFFADLAGVTPEMQVHPTICADLLELLPDLGVAISPVVMQSIRRTHQLNSSENLYRAIVNGDIDACNSIVKAAPCFPNLLEECVTCTPLIVAIIHEQLDIAKLLLDHKAPTNGAPCTQINYLGFKASALEIAIQKPVFNTILGRLLNQCLLQETHWSQRFDYWRPFHVAAAFNPGAIEILANHVLSHSTLFRYVGYSRHKLGHLVLARV